MTPKQKDKYLIAKYGITIEEYYTLLLKQDNLCAMCKDPDPTHRLCVDHIHVKGFKKMKPEEKKKYVRGILCFMCNTSIKGFDRTISGDKNRARLEGAHRYFQQYALKGEI